MPTNLYPAPFSKWHQGPIVLPAPPSHAPPQEFSPEAMSMMSGPTMQAHMAMSPGQTIHASMSPMSRQAPGAVLTNGMASEYGVTHHQIQCHPQLTSVLTPDPFVHHNSLSTAGKPRAYHPSNQSVFAPMPSHPDMYGEMADRGGVTHAGTIYPDAMSIAESHHICHGCENRRERERQRPLPCSCTCRHQEYSDNNVQPSGRNRSSSRSGESDVYRRPQAPKRSSHGRHDMPMSPTGHPSRYPSDDRGRPERAPSRDREVHRDMQPRPTRRYSVDELDMAHLGVTDHSRSGSRGPEQQQRRPRTVEHGSRNPSGDRQSSRGPSQRGPSLRGVAEGPDPLYDVAEVYPLPAHHLSPSRQHRLAYKGHKPAAIDSYSKLRRDPAKPRGYGRD